MRSPPVASWMVRLSCGIIALAVVEPAGEPATAQASVVRADGPPAWGPQVRLVPLGSLGTVDGPPEYALASVRYLVGAKNGDFYTYDGQAVQLRHYGADGKFIRAIGRKGSGPGEYQQLMGLVLVGDSLLVAWDPSNRRVTYYGADGKLRRSFSPPLSSIMFGSDIFAVDAAGRVVIQYATRNDTNVYARFRADGGAVDTLRGSVRSDPGLLLSFPEGSRYSFHKSELVKPDPRGGLLRASTPLLGFTTEKDGRAVTVLRKSVAIPVGKQEREEWERMTATLRPQARTSAALPSKMPATKPAIRDVFADRNGRVWLDAYTVAEKRPDPAAGEPRRKFTWFERATFEVFAAEGRYLGRVVLPPLHSLVAVNGDRLWTYTSGPDDEIRIAFFKMVRSSGAPLGN